VPAEPSRIQPDRAVVDRIVDGATAVLLVGPDEAELLVPADSLPDGAGDGTWVVLDLDASPPRVVGTDDALTAARAAGLASRLDAIRKERRGGRFDA
jgi:hypothetical protein